MSRLKQRRPSPKGQRRRKYVQNVLRGAIRLRKETGHLNEARLIRILNDPDTADHRPPWLLRATPATEKQDHQGVDVIVTTENCAVFLQVKSSQVFEKSFRDQRRLRLASGLRTLRIGTIIVNDGLEDREIAREALRVITRLRDETERYGIYCTTPTTPDD